MEECIFMQSKNKVIALYIESAALKRKTEQIFKNKNNLILMIIYNFNVSAALKNIFAHQSKCFCRKFPSMALVIVMPFQWRPL
jgi:hypothetical protein